MPFDRNPYEFSTSFNTGRCARINRILTGIQSAHLALVPYWFQWNLSEESVFLFGVLVQMGTLISVIIYFRKDILQILGAFQWYFPWKTLRRPESPFGMDDLLATVPAAVAGALIKDTVESA